MRFIRKPSITMYSGVRVDKDTFLEYENENVKQTVKDLIYHSVTVAKGDRYESILDTTIQLNEGDVLILDDARGYILPANADFVTVAEAIEELNCLDDEVE